MPYDIKDILSKIILINEDRITIYKECEKCLKDNKEINTLKYQIIVNALIKEIRRENQYYKTLRDRTLVDENENINVLSYDKISFLMNQFQKNISFCTCLNLGELIPSFIDKENKMLALLISIQGRLVITNKDTKTIAYITLSEMINNRKEAIRKLEVVNIKHKK